jgi:hypothetical protein
MVGDRMYLLLHYSETEASIYMNLPAGYLHQVTLITSEISMMYADRCLKVAETPLRIEARRDHGGEDDVERTGEKPELHV